MSRTLTITAADPPVVPGERMFLVLEGIVLDRCDHKYYTCAEVGCDGSGVSIVPPTFARACAPCETCRGRQYATEVFTASDGRPAVRVFNCPDCRIKLVGPCPACGGKGGFHNCTNGTVTLGYAYAVGQPLPIIASLPTPPAEPCVEADDEGFVVWRRERGPYGGTAWRATHTPLAALAHYGSPESLVGKWAIELEVQP